MRNKTDDVEESRHPGGHTAKFIDSSLRKKNRKNQNDLITWLKLVLKHIHLEVGLENEA